MKDFQIREILHSTELTRFHSDGASRVVEEMKIPVAKARIDIAVINGHLHGYEIKSASDNLQRLPNQIIAYSYVFDYVTVITEDKYYQKIVDTVPAWVGVSICAGPGAKDIFVKRPASQNLGKQSFYLAKLLWHDELIEVLSEQSIPFKKKYRNWILCEILANSLHTDRLSEIVREKLKKRKTWKS